MAIKKPAAIQPVVRAKKVAMLVYGSPGCGKTRLIGTGKKTLILRPPMDHTDSIRSGDAEEWVIHDWAAMDDAYTYLRDAKPGTYNWVWLDSISLMQDQGLDDIWEVVTTKNPHRKEFGVDKGEYGINMQRLARWTRHMVACATDHGLFNFGVTAHPMEIDHEEVGGGVKLRPYVQGKNMSHKICGYMNIVAYMEVVRNGGKARRVLRFAETDEFEAKDQFDAFLPKNRLVDPTMPKITSALREARGSSTRNRTRRRRSRQKGR